MCQEKTYYLMSRVETTKAVVRSFWIGRRIHRLAPYLLLLISIIGWKKYRMRKQANLKSRLVDLPHEVIESILLRLPTKSIFSMQCASKAISSIIKNPLFASLHMSTLLKSGMNSVATAEVPKLMLFDRSETNGCLFQIQLQPLKHNGKSDLTNSNYRFLVSKILSNSIYIVDFVFHNLLFFSSQSTSGGPSYLVNPLKGEVLKIPAATETESWDWYGMGFDSTTNSYKIVHAYKKNYQLAAGVYVLRPRSLCQWREIQAVPPCDLSTKNLCAYGDMHWLVSVGSNRDIGGGTSHIISFDFKKEEFCWTPHPTFHEICNNIICLNDYFLLNMKGSMTIVDISSRDYIWIWRMKSYREQEWSLDYRISMEKFVERPTDVFEYYTCGEWEKGIYFAQGKLGLGRGPIVYYILDLQHTSMKRMEKQWSGFAKGIFNYTGSLISLKEYGDLVEATTQPNVWHFA